MIQPKLLFSCILNFLHVSFAFCIVLFCMYQVTFPSFQGLKARGNVEDWLTKVEESMFTSLRRIMKSALMTYSNSNMDVWVLSQPSQVTEFIKHFCLCLKNISKVFLCSQVVLTISQMIWAQTVEMILGNRHTAIKEMQTFEKKNFSVSSIIELRYCVMLPD